MKLNENIGPWIYQDSERQREWLFVEPARYYLAKNKSGKWGVIDRDTDFYVLGGCNSRNQAIRAFYKQNGRPIPSGTSLPKFATSSLV